MQESEYLKGRMDLIKRFKQLPLLKSLDDVYLKRIMEMSKIRKYIAGETITPEGAYDCWFYVLLGGEVKIVKGNDEIARLKNIGDTFGELAVVDGEARSASVQAVDTTVCLAVDASSLDRKDMPEHHVFYAVIYRLFAEIVASRLRAVNEELVRLRHENALLKGETTSADGMAEFALDEGDVVWL